MTRTPDDRVVDDGSADVTRDTDARAQGDARAAQAVLDGDARDVGDVLDSEAATLDALDLLDDLSALAAALGASDDELLALDQRLNNSVQQWEETAWAPPPTPQTSTTLASVGAAVLQLWQRMGLWAPAAGLAAAAVVLWVLPQGVDDVKVKDFTAERAVRVKVLHVDGDLDEADVIAGLNVMRPSLTQCASALDDDEDVDATFVVNVQGAAEDVLLQPAAAATAGCLDDVLRKTSFGLPLDPTDVGIRFHFSPPSTQNASRASTPTE